MEPEPVNHHLLIQLLGPDGPGITSDLMSILECHHAAIEDVEQVAIRRKLILGVIANVELTTTLEEQLNSLGARHNLEVSVSEVDRAPTERALGTIVTCLGPTVGPGDLAAVSSAISAVGGNIDKIYRLARYPVWAYEFTVLGAEARRLREALGSVTRARGIDIAVQAEGITRRAQRLVVMDVDSTLIQNEVIELLAEEMGCFEEVARITAEAMNGDIEFAESLRRRVALLRGLTLEQMCHARERMELTPGARTFVRTLHRLGFKVAIVSGGFTFFTDHLLTELGLDYAYANELELVDGVATGNLLGTIVDRVRKAEILTELAGLEHLPVEQVIAVGDGANDLDMLQRAGLGVAFNAKATVQEQADTTVNVPYLDSLLFLLGIRRSEIDAADQADGTPVRRPPIPE